MRCATVWRLIVPMYAIAATATVLTSSNRPYPVVSSFDAPPTRRAVCSAPLATTTISAGAAMRAKPRSAWTRSSSPGPASTTRASSTMPPNQAA